MTKVGFIGLGTMGSQMAGSLLRAGHQLLVYDVNSRPVEALVALGAERAETPAALAAAVDQIHLSLPDSPQLLEVALGIDGLRNGAHAGLVLVDHSTVAPATAQRLAEEFLPLDVHWLDAPVSGGPAGAKAATLTIMIGGDVGAFEKARPVLESIGKNLEYMGKSGLGATTKVVNQLVVGVTAMAVFESFSLAHAAGLTAQRTHEILSTSSAACWLLDKVVPAVLLTNRQADVPAAWFALRLQHKDMRLAVETAAQLGVPLAAGTLAAQTYAMAEGQGWGDRDQIGAIALYADYLGIDAW